MLSPRHPPSARRAFSLVEMTVLMVVLAFIATIAVPRFMSSVERVRAVEAFRFGEDLAIAQEQHRRDSGLYTDSLGELGLDLRGLAFFSVSGILLDEVRGDWRVHFTRTGASGGFGSYVVVFDRTGFNRVQSSIPPHLTPAR